MEGLAPPLECLIAVRSSLQNGESVRTGMFRFMQTSKCEFATQIRQFIFDFDRGLDWRARLTQMKSPYRRSLVEICALGLAGEPILTAIDELMAEVQLACDSEIKERLDLLPLQMLFPLLLFLFPAYLLLLFGPLVSSFLKEMAQ
jgi:hypothetical protein